nr:hypothetical protein [Tanacetum cinerariifolium]
MTQDIGARANVHNNNNVVCNTLVDICYRSGISAGKELDIGSSPLTQIGMVDFILGQAVIDAAQRKWAKLETSMEDVEGVCGVSDYMEQKGEMWPLLGPRNVL